MPLASSILLPARSDPAVRAVARAWRRLTGGTHRGGDRARRTLIACSGGGDSCGLVLALAAAVSDPARLFVIGHIVHDMRSQAEALADRDAARNLAAGLGLPFVEGTAAVKAAGSNPEAAARRLRYRALSRLAQDEGCPYVATAHHAGDQLETILMALIRGAGPRGLAGVAPKRRMRGLMLIRPALEVGRVDLRRLCRAAGWTWSEDATNADQSRLRAAVRHRITPEIERLRPGAAARAAQSAAMLRDAAGLIQDRTRILLAAAVPTGDGAPLGLTWDRPLLRPERGVVLGSLLKSAADRLLSGRRRDRLGSAALGPVIHAIRSRGVHERRFQWSGLEVTVDARAVQIRRLALD